jgi:hypothetical protein
MPEPDSELEEWAVGDYPEVLDPDLVPRSWSEQPRRDDAGRPAQAALGFEAGTRTPSEPVNSWLELARLWIEWDRDEVAGHLRGDGSDGDVTIPAGTTNLTRDMYYESLSVPAGRTLNTRGFRVFVRGVLTLDGLLHANGGNASGATPGANATATTMGNGLNGGAAIAGDGNDADPSVAGAEGGPGGDEGGGGQAGGAGGVRTFPTEDQGGERVLRSLHTAFTGRTFQGDQLQGGPSGGGGGGVGSGAGGAGANVLGVVCRELAISATGVLSSRGGRGGNASSGNGGGGGNGAGGVVILATRRGDIVFDAAAASYDADTNLSGLYNVGDGWVDVRGTVAAGVATGFGTGLDGNPGTAGSVWWLRC